MPTILRTGPFRLYFYSSDGQEPRHIHVHSGDGSAKYWLEPLRLANSHGLNASELGRIRSIIGENQTLLIEAWDEFFGR